MRIAEETVQRIQQQSDILEVVQDFVALKKKGSNWTACCPFHQEKTPSFSVSPSRGIYKCFGCGRAGDSISFVMEIEQCTYVEALQYLAKKYQIELQTEISLSDEDRAAQKEQESLLVALDFAQQYFQKLLLHSELGQALGLAYLRERGFKNPVIEKFGLGFSSEAWDGLLKAASTQGFSVEVLEKAGLIIRKEEGKAFDRFRDRVIFPIHNLAGRPIAFGARLLKKDPKQAKYLNSPETPVYHKSQVLYGIFQAKKAIREQNNCYLVEGYTDVISLHQAGIENVVASSGTALTEAQIRLMKRFCHQVTVLYDGDAAGLKASQRGIDLILAQGLDVRVVLFPEGQDPDSYVHKIGPTAFGEFLHRESQDFITYKASLLQQEARHDPLRKAETIREVVQSIVLIPDEIKRRVFFQACSRILDIDEATLIREGNLLLRREAVPKPLLPDVATPSSPDQETEEAVQAVSAAYPQEKAVLRLFLLYSDVLLEENGLKLGQFFRQELEEITFEDPACRELFGQLCQAIKAGQTIVPKSFLGMAPPKHKAFLADLLAEHYPISQHWAEKFHVHTPQEQDLLLPRAVEHVLRLKLYHLQKMQKENEQALIQAITEAAQDQALQQAIRLKAVQQEIASRLQNTIYKTS
ncbi:MAG: DNA primase [Microscillaceae bacterium]|nr:DNA primase [Microscillaceae bacterium]